MRALVVLALLVVALGAQTAPADPAIVRDVIGPLMEHGVLGVFCVLFYRDGREKDARFITLALDQAKTDVELLAALKRIEDDMAWERRGVPPKGPAS